MTDQVTAADEKAGPSYAATLQDIVRAGQAPQSFLEHPATGFIPVIGPVLAAAGGVARQARQRELITNLTYLHSLVSSGQLTDPQQVERLNLPDPLVKSAMIEAEKVRRSPEFQEGRIAQKLFAQVPGQFEQSMQLQPAQPGSTPSAVMPGNLLYGGAYRQARDQAEPELEAKAFQTIAEKYPTIFASSSPKTAEVGLQSRELAAADALAQFLGFPTGREGSAPAPSPQMRPGSSQSPPGSS